MSYIFITYGLENSEDAAWISDQLHAKGFEVWGAGQGETSNSARLDAVKNCQVLMVLMTPLASRSARVQRESMQAASLNKPVFPVLLKGELFPEYRTLPYIDLREGLSIPGAMVKMLKALVAGDGDAAADQGDLNLDTTILGQPQALRDLAKLIRAGLGGNQPRGITQELEVVENNGNDDTSIASA